MVRCIVYLINETKDNIWCCGFSGSDWHRYNGGLAPANSGNHAVAAIDCPEGLTSNYGWLFFTRDRGDHRTYFQLLMRIEYIRHAGGPNEWNLQAMGTGRCSLEDVENLRPNQEINGSFHGSGTENAEKGTDHGVLRWYPAKSSRDTLGFLDWPSMYFTAAD